MRADLFLRYYSEIDAPHGFHTISIDGSEPEEFDGRNSGGQLAQQLLWSKTDLSPGRHTFVLRQFDVDGKFCSLDYFRSVTSGTTEGRYTILTPLLLLHPTVSFLLTRRLRYLRVPQLSRVWAWMMWARM